MSGAPLPRKHDVEIRPADQRLVLIVDDDEDLLDALVSALSRLSPRLAFVGARTVEAALGILGKAEVALVVSDYHLPGTDGVQFLAKVAQQNPGVRRVLLTGDPDRDLGPMAQTGAGVDRLFIKPVDIRSLSRVCEQLAFAKPRTGEPMVTPQGAEPTLANDTKPRKTTGSRFAYEDPHRR